MSHADPDVWEHDVGSVTVRLPRRAERVIQSAGTTATACFVFIDSIPHLEYVAFAPADYPHGFTHGANGPARLDAIESIDWRSVFEGVMAQEIARALAPLLGQMDGDRVEGITRAAIHDARTTVRPRRNNRWSAEFAREVAALYKAGGIEQVAEGTNVVDRQARRYLDRARKEGLL
jgi:hypothetical protein